MLPINLIKIALVDDHRLFRQTLKIALSQDPHLCVVLQADDGEDLIRQLPDSKPDIIVLDINMPKRNGIETLKVLSDKYPEINVVVLSAFADEVFVAQCLPYGIFGYLTKTMNLTDLIEAIKQAYKGEMYVSNLLQDRLLKKYLVSCNKKVSDLLPHFSMDEIRLLELLKQEKTTEEISDLMNFSKRSIEIKRDKMREKANTKTIGGLLIYALKRGIIQ